MGMAAILVNGHQPFKQSFIPLPQGGSKCNLSNTGPQAPKEKSFETLNIFPIQMHREANLTWPKNGQLSMYDHYFSNFGRPPVPKDICKDSAIRHRRFQRRRFLKVFTIYGHGSHLGQWMAASLAVFHFPASGRLQMKFEQHWPRGSRGGHLKF